RRKHRIGFETALLVFDHPNAIAVQDREIEGEQRWQTVGRAHTAIVVVAHSIGEEDGDEVIRIISARKARHQNGHSMKKKLTKTQERELAALAALPDEQIDTSDIPEIKSMVGGV